jgi:hypothetical protein
MIANIKSLHRGVMRGGHISSIVDQRWGDYEPTYFLISRP